MDGCRAGRLMQDNISVNERNFERQMAFACNKNDLFLFVSF